MLASQTLARKFTLLKKKKANITQMFHVGSGVDVDNVKKKMKSSELQPFFFLFLLLTGVSGSSENRFNLSSLLAERIPSSVSEMYCEVGRKRPLES